MLKKYSEYRIEYLKKSIPNTTQVCSLWSKVLAMLKTNWWMINFKYSYNCISEFIIILLIVL